MFTHKISDFCKKHPYLLLTVLIGLTGIVAYHQYIFGNLLFMFQDIGSDTADQYIMQYSTVVNHIRNGNYSLWDFTNGFGTSMYQLNLFNPSMLFLYAIGVIGGPQLISHVLIYVHLLLLILAGLMAWKFLSCFSFRFESKLIAAYLYAFNGYLTVWGQHYQFSIMLVYLPLLLYLIERSLQRRKFSPAAVICTACMLICTYYLSYMVLIVCAMYVPLRLFQTRRDGFFRFLVALFAHGFSLLLGVFMGILNLLPSYALVFSVSARMEGQTSFVTRCISMLKPWPLAAYYKTLVCRLFANTLEGIGTAQAGFTGYGNFYEAPCLFFSGLLIILLVQYIFVIFFRKETDLRTRLVQLFVLLGGCFSVGIMFGSFVFNAFSLPFSRHTFLLMPLFALMTAYMLDLILFEHSFNLIGALIALLPAEYIYLTTAKNQTLLTLRLNALILAGTCFIAVILLLLISRRKAEKHSYVLYVLLCLTLGLNVASDTYTTAAKRGFDKNNTAYTEALYGSDWQTLTDYLAATDGDFYRLEKDYSAGSSCMDSAGQYYRGISTYNSTSNRYILEFLNKAVPELYYINNAHWTFRQVSDQMDLATLFGIKYVVSKSSTPPAPSFVPEKTFGSLYLYRNTAWTSFGRFYTDTVANYDYETIEAPVNTDAFLLDYLLLDDEQPDIDVTNTASVLRDYALTEIDSLTVSPDLVPDTDGIYAWQAPETFLPFNRAVTAEDGELIVQFKAVVNGSYDLQIRTTEELYNYKTITITAGQPADVTMQLPEGTTGLFIHDWDPNLITGVSDFHFYQAPAAKNVDNSAAITVTDMFNDSHILCEADLKKDGYLFLPIPYETGWTATVNGEEATILRADYGFSALKLSAGNYEISFDYRQPLFKESLLIMAVSWGIFLVLVILHLRISRRKHSAHVV